MDVILTDDQKQAVDRISNWFYNRTNISQIFTLAGYAGTGKTFLINHLVKNILKLDIDNISFVAPTGKAASQLTKKGLKATTIHKLIYLVEEIDIPQVDKNGDVMYDKDNKPLITKKLKYKKRDFIEKDYKLIIIDEISMVDQHTLDDICSFDIPILAVGDSWQLPAIVKSHNLLDHPDCTLTEVVRQALDNPIINVATQIRNGINLPNGKYGSSVVIASKRNLSQNFIDKLLLDFDQIICGTNNTRRYLNERVRLIKDIDIEKDRLPIVGDKVICTCNNWSKEFGEDNIYSLVNGMIGYVSDIDINPSEYVDFIKLNINPDFSMKDKIEDLYTDPGIFSEEYEYKYKLRQKIYRGSDGRLSLKDFNIGLKKKKDETSEEYSKRILNDILNRHAKEELQLNRFEFGYAITCHKAQGSEFESVIVFDQSFIMRSEEDKQRWLYTAITRAKERLVILR